MSDKIPYSFSEAYGPFPCERIIDADGNTCNQEAWTVLIDPDEFKRLPDNEITRPRYILENGIGEAVCDQHSG